MSVPNLGNTVNRNRGYSDPHFDGLPIHLYSKFSLNFIKIETFLCFILENHLRNSNNLTKCIMVF